MRCISHAVFNQVKPILGPGRWLRRTMHSLPLAALLLSGAVHASSLPSLITIVLEVHPSLRAQQSLGAASEEAVNAARWQFYPMPSVSMEMMARAITGSPRCVCNNPSALAVA